MSATPTHSRTERSAAAGSTRTIGFHLGAARLLAAAFALQACAQASPAPTEDLKDGMAVVEAGWFLMGDDSGPMSSRPQRRVYLDAFAIDLYEVTNAAFGRYVGDMGASVAGWSDTAALDRPDHPVTGVLHSEASAYCRWAGKRLPSEAEWEKAARGLNGHRYPWGDAWDSTLANTLESGVGGVRPVGSYPDGASPYGLMDMAGNAAEWVADFFDPDYYSFGPDVNPTGPERVHDHVLRGGSWAFPQRLATTFFRDSSHSVRPNPRVGFRCALSLSGSHVSARPGHAAETQWIVLNLQPAP